MIPYLRLDAVLPGGVPSNLIPDEMDDAIGHIPGWAALLDPEYQEAAGVLNRATGGLFAPPTPWDQDNEGLFPNGHPAFRITTNGSQRLISDTAINPDAWTVFFVLNVTSEGVTGARDLIAPENVSSPDIALRVAIRTAGQVSIYPASAASPRLTASPTALPADGSSFLLMCTGSTREGLRIYVNGEEVAAAPEDMAPLNDQLAAGQWNFYRSNSGTGDLLAGITGLLGIDLGWPEHAGYRRSVERFLMSRYGIS